MPNWVTNRMKVTGPAKSVSAVKEFITNKEAQTDWWSGEKGAMLIDFNRIIPQPPDVLASAEKQEPGPGLPLWYTWRVDHWGTKWDPWEPSPDMDKPGCYSIYFVTAWGHPVPIFAELAKRFKDCKVEVWYWIEGNGGGKDVYKWSEEDADVLVEQKENETSRFRRLVEDRQFGR